jgi:DNA-binding CsgD family transcriptional regulator
MKISQKFAAERLSPRQGEVLKLIADGVQSREICKALHISPKTLEAHKQHLKNKFNLNSAPELYRFAVLMFCGVLELKDAASQIILSRESCCLKPADVDGLKVALANVSEFIG